MTYFTFDSFSIDEETRILRNADGEVSISPKVADLLLLFLRDPEKLFKKGDLKRQGWPDMSVVGDSNVFYHLSVLKNALGRRPDGGPYIETLHGRGYRFVAPVLKVVPELNGIASESSAITTENRPVETVVTLWTHQVSLRRLQLPVILGMGCLLAFLAILVFRSARTPQLFVAKYVALTQDGLEKQDGLLLTDGPRVYFGEGGRGGFSFKNVSSLGGTPAAVNLPLGLPYVYDLSASGSDLLLSSKRPEGNTGCDLWRAPVVGGSPIRIGDIRIDSATWSPDGKEIAYGLGSGLYIVAANGTDPRKVVEIADKIQSVRWSPDGRRLSFTAAWQRGDEVRRFLWQVRRDGSDLHRLLDGWNPHPLECCGVWAAGGRAFIFQSTGEGRTDLWTLPVGKKFVVRDDRPPTRLTSGLVSYSAPTASSDPHSVFAIGTERRGELVRYDSRLRQFVPFFGAESVTWVVFSRSGNSVAYTRYPDLTVWRAKPDGSEKVQITFAPFTVDGLAWSPDERWLAMRGRTGDRPWQIYLVPVAGGEPQLLDPSGREQGVPAWSADNTRIAFGDVPPIHDKSSGTEAIHIFDLKSHSQSDLPGSQGLWSARWSPDGRYLSAVTIEGGRLMLYDFTTKAWRATQAVTVNNPNWDQDGRYIYFDTEAPLRTLNRVRVDDGQVEQLADLKSYRTLSWWWSGVTPDGSPLILRDIGSSEIYSLLLDYK